MSLANETKLNVTSIDINKKAIKLSRLNDLNNKVKFIEVDFNFFKSEVKFDLLISNPPYIDNKDKHIEK